MFIKYKNKSQSPQRVRGRPQKVARKTSAILSRPSMLPPFTLPFEKVAPATTPKGGSQTQRKIENY